MKKAILFILSLSALIISSFSLAKADQSLVTDISSHLISVTSDFTGTELLLFGKIESIRENNPSRHGDIIVVVRGPLKDLLIRKKERVLGIWANTQSLDIQAAPGFYAMLSNRPVMEISDESTLRRLKIGPDRLNLESKQTLKPNDEYAEAVVRQRKQENLFVQNEKGVQFLGNQLFRSSVYFPANVPVGNYVSEVYFFEDGELISAQTSPLFIKKFGLGRRIYDFAQQYPAIHGILAIILALFAGWLASAIFRKD
ncbi:hypothetical protein GUA87_00915 [Sneathiella sp. P13V-1]|uniref:TIGR02186 family protein n=1 Tax=Sneathiella sp. P13V-1 TaxID=2697366 RepID=UPI00187B5CC3|nr:TIGR02186 family protein [Sneathiella sp. P13V-1]MBE7635390.1 hypothetical protein [Sneathiella sp. P13V-1]